MSSGMTLSDRFDRSEKQRAAVKSVHNIGGIQRRDDLNQRRRVGRQTQIDARRQGLTNAKPVMRTAQAKTITPRRQQTGNHVQGRGQGRGTRGSKASANKSSGISSRGQNRANGRNDTTGRGNSRNARGRGGGGGRGRGRASGKGDGRGGDKKAFTAPSDPAKLDEGLDEYWFKAGIGPDPKVASLDRGLDNYWNTKGEEKNGDVAPEDKGQTAGMSDVAEPSEGGDGMDPDL